MALAKTNATAYNTNLEEGNEEPLSISTSAIVLNGNNEIKDIIDHNGTNLIFMKDSTRIFVSTNGGSYLEIDLEFTVNDVIYSDSMEKFVAVGSGSNKIKIKTSHNAVTWEEADWGSFETGSYKSSIIAIMELGESFLVVGYYQPSTSNIYFAVNVSFTNDTYTYSEYITFNASGQGNAFKGNNRIILDSKRVITPGVYTVTNYYPVEVADGYFIAITGQKLYRSINGVDYNLLGTCAIEPVSVMKHDGYYYIFGKNAACRGNTWIEAMNKGIEEYVPYDGGIEIPFTSTALLDEKIALLCNGYILILNTGGGSNPVTEAIETLSAKAALKKAMSYVDEKIAALEERVADLENANSEPQAE